MANVNLLKTKAGKGFKLCIDGKWFYTSNREMTRLYTKKCISCGFRSQEEVNEYAGKLLDVAEEMKVDEAILNEKEVVSE